MMLTPRDRSILELLAEVSILTTEQISTLFFPSINACRNRLVILKRAGWLKEERPYQFHKNSTKIVKLGKRACDIFQFSFCRAYTGSFFDHQLGLNEIYVQLTKRDLFKKFNIIWQDGSKFTLPYDRTYLRPDARIFHPIPNYETYIEYDRSTKILPTIGENIAHYLTFFDEMNLRSKKEEKGRIQVIYLTPFPSRASSIDKQFRKLFSDQNRNLETENYSFNFWSLTEEQFLARAPELLDYQNISAHPPIKTEQVEASLSKSLNPFLGQFPAEVLLKLQMEETKMGKGKR